MKTPVQMENNSKILRGAMTMRPTLDKTTNGSSPRQTFRLMVPDLIHKAEQFLKSGALELSVGTYTARDLHRLLNKTCKNYYQRDKTPSFLFTQSCPIDVNCTQWIVQNHRIYCFPWFNVFYVLWKCEIQAGWSGHKAHKFIVEDKRECVAESIITFPEEMQAKKLSSLVRKNNFLKDKPCQLSLSDGCIRSTYSASWDHDHKGRIFKSCIEPYDGFLLSPSEFSAPNDFIDLCVRYDAHQLRHLYGECKIRIFKNNKESEGVVPNPYNIRVTIENSDGWIVSSDIVEYKIKYLSFEDINEKRHEYAQNEKYNGLIRTTETLHNHECVHDTKVQEDEDYSINDTLNKRSTNNRDEKTAHTHQKPHLFLPYRKLSNPSVFPTCEESRQSISTPSQLLHPLYVEINIAHIRKLYGECKLRVYIRKAFNCQCNNPHNVFLLIETADSWIIGNEFLRYKFCTPRSLSLPAPHAEVRTLTLPNHQPAIRELIGTGSSPSASIHKPEFGLTASQESKKYCIPTTHTPTRKDIEHSVKNLLISRKKNE